MIVTLTAAAALILSLLLIFIESVIVKIILISLILFIGIYAFIDKKKCDKKDELRADDQDKLKSLRDEKNRISARLEEIELLNSEKAEEKSEKEIWETSLIEDASLFCSSLPLMKELTSLVVDKTEESAINLTENIFQISNKSSQVGNHISNFLNDMFAGDKSLKNNIDVLNDKMKSINKLINDFSSIKNRYTVDMKKIENNVQVINGFLSGIRDVSDRTGLLAINSSIEAARVGTAGKGFSVLAGEIQGLARSSKEISLQIDEVVDVISETVEESFHTLEKEISNTLEELSQTHEDLNVISVNLNDKVSDVENHVKDSDSLSKTVTEQLNNVSVNMQYQDITRQILEHIMSTLYHYRTKLEEKDSRIIAQNDKKENKDKIIQVASGFFTIEDEWKLFGLDSVASEPVPENEKSEFKGNVELF